MHQLPALVEEGFYLNPISRENRELTYLLVSLNNKDYTKDYENNCPSTVKMFLIFTLSYHFGF